MLDYTAINQVVEFLFSDAESAAPSVGNEGEFVAKVRLASVILKSNNPISYEDIKRATPGVYHRVALRIAAARFPQLNVVTQDAQGNQTLNQSGNTYQWIDDDIMAMLSPPPRPGNVLFPGTVAASTGNERLNTYGAAIEWAASKLVAAHVVRNIPLNNSSLKFVDIADNLETQALEDIDRIIRIEQGSASGGSTTTQDAESKGQITLCLAHDINKTSLPETAFDVPDPGSSPPTYTGTINPSNVTVAPSISVPANTKSYCHVYMTGQVPQADQDLIVNRNLTGAKGESQDSRSVSFAIRLNIPLKDGWTIDDLIIEIADSINSACLSPGHSSITFANASSTLSNILCTANTKPIRSTSVTIRKDRLYPNTTTNKGRLASFNLDYKVNCLDFTTRRYSNKVVTELFNVTFYSIVDLEDPSNLAVDEATPDSGTHNYFDTDLNIDTEDSLTKIKRKVEVANEDADSNYEFRLGVEGLIFGEEDNYLTMNAKSPRGFFLTVQKGDRASVSVESTGGSSSQNADALADTTAVNTLDTLYFYTEPSASFSSGNQLQLRVSSTNYNAETPETVLVDLTGVISGEEVAERVVQELYEYTSNQLDGNPNAVSNSNVLGVQLGDFERTYTNINLTNNTVRELPLEERMDGADVFEPATVQRYTAESLDVAEQDWIKDAKSGRVQLVGFKYARDEYRIVVDVINVPPGLQIATGNFISRKSSWTTNRRSIQVDLQTLNAGTTTVTQTTAEELASVNASVGKAEATKSRLLQKVYDKRRLLDEAKKGFPTKWHSQT